MSVDPPKHEMLANRLAEILLKLNLDERPSRQELAAEFKVTERTIYRDLNRLGSIVEQLPDGRYQLVSEYRGKLKPKDLKSFAQLAGVEQLFPEATPQFLVALLDTLCQGSFLVHGHQYERFKPHDKSFDLLNEAVTGQRICRLTYRDTPRELHPYRLINKNGIWYLAATEQGQLKAFAFSRISQLSVTEQTFTPDATIQANIENEDDIWFSREKTEVLLSIAPEIAYYFRRRKLLPKQELVRELESGGLIVSSQISHVDQILPLAQFWLPRIRVVEPAWLRERLETVLRDYLEQK